MPDLLGEHVQDALHREVGLVRAEAAHGARRRVVGVDRGGLDVHVGHAERAAGMTRGALEDLAADAGVGAVVAGDPRPDRDEVALRVAAGGVVEPHRVALDVEPQALAPGELEQHRAAGRDGEQRGLALDAEVLLAAERAAGGDLGHEDLARLQPQERRDLAPVLPGALPGGVDVHPVRGDGRAIRPDRAPRNGEGGLGLQERMLDGGGPEAGAGHVRGAGEGRVHVTAPHDGAGDDVAALVDLGRAVGEGREGIGDGGERFQLHLDQGGSGGGGLPRLSGDRGQHVAHVPDDLALRDQERPVRADQALLATAWDIGCGQHRNHAGNRTRCRRVDGAHEGARDAREAQRTVEHARRHEIAHEGLLAQGELMALVARTGHGLHAGRLAAADGGGERDRIDDRRVPGAAAEVAGQDAGDGLSGRLRVPSQEGLGLHHDAR